MNEVWIVEQGCYSDRHIVRVFDNEDDATAFCDKRNKGDADWDHCFASKWTVGEAGYFTGVKHAAQWSEGNGEQVWSYDVDEPLDDMEVKQGSGGSIGHWVAVHGYDRDRVLRALHDRVAQLKAEVAGIT